mmetsp:Transcript_65573/g.77071  ORF Transcript_65573/g.77071 Transcript_65573/m.77071 type:complete len:87 (+) Transcript_65573:278-538(+)
MIHHFHSFPDKFKSLKISIPRNERHLLISEEANDSFLCVDSFFLITNLARAEAAFLVANGCTSFEEFASRHISRSRRFSNNGNSFA